MNKNLILTYEDVELRDMIEDDIRDYIDWFTIKTDWQDWYAPWENYTRDREVLEKALRDKLRQAKPVLETDLEIVYDNRHVGWITSYPLDGEADSLAIKLFIAEPKFWERGIGEKALVCFVRYILERDPYRDIFLEVWTENKRMENLALKLGFEASPLERSEKNLDGRKYIIDKYKLIDENVSRYRI